jgi:gluconolactonase
MVRRRVFADMSADGTNGVPDGMKVDAAGRVFCTGTDGVWVFAPDGTKIGTIEMPEVCANVAFGGPDLRTLFLTASTSVYTLRVKTPGLPHPWCKLRGK